MSAPDSTPQSAPDIQREIEQTRERLGETVEQLAAKADVKTRAQAKVAEVKTRAAGQGGRSVGAGQGEPGGTPRLAAGPNRRGHPGHGRCPGPEAEDDVTAESIPPQTAVSGGPDNPLELGGTGWKNTLKRSVKKFISTGAP
jgi:Protein of unknown function (DUF3618).